VRHPAIGQGGGRDRGGRIKEELKIAIQRFLGLLDQEEIVSPRLLHLPTQRPLAKEGIAGQHSPRPINARQQRRGHGQFGLGFVVPGRNWLMGQDDAAVVTEGPQRVDRTASVGKPESPSLRFAIDGHALRGGIGRRRHGTGTEGGGQGGRQGVPIEPAKQTLQRRLAGGARGGKAEGSQHRGVLAGSPLGNRQHGAVVGQNRRNGEGDSGLPTEAVRSTR